MLKPIFSKIKNYTCGFDVWGFLLFVVIMLPNFIWFSVPAPNDVLRKVSATALLDTVASVCQGLMVAALCIFRHRARNKIRATPLIVCTVIFCFLYGVCWVNYYLGIVNIPILLGLTVLPCLSFLFFAIDRKNGIAVLPIVLFTICHLIYCIVNFII